MPRGMMAPVFSVTRRALLGGVLAAIAGLPASCGWPRRGAESPAPDRLSFIVLASERDLWAPVVERFGKAHGVRVEMVEGPNATDLRESMYTTSLLAGDDSLDVVYMDVTWTSKFAAAGWLLTLDDVFRPEELSALLPQALDAGRYRGHLYRIPVRSDVGVLYYRRDLLDASGIAPPETFGDLVAAARRLQSPPDRWGFVWQGSQYEGLTCVFLEILRGAGGFWVDPDSLEVGLDRREAVAALEFLRRSRAVDAISPPGVTSLKEDDSRRVFQDGRAVFLLNWPYVWRLAQGDDSRVAGKIGVSAVPHAPGRQGGGTLGGWGFGISRFSRNPALAAQFIREAVSLESQRALCLTSGYAPARVEAYRDPRLLASNPLLPEIFELHANAVTRPAIPGYALASDILQRHVSACLAGLATAESALSNAAKETRLLLGRSR
ncbi:MAG: ABC transporter substrate-binding protein [Acidobacteriota bacterium]